MPILSLSVPTHLCIFVTDPETGRPVQRLPLYAEVAVPRNVPAPPDSGRLNSLIRNALLEIDPTTESDQEIRNRIQTATLQAIAEVTDDVSRDKLVSDVVSEGAGRVVELFCQIFKEVLATSNRSSMTDIPSTDLKPLIVTALRRVAPEFGLGLIPEVEDNGAVWAEPLGVLTTDHVGYASFDLRRLRPDVQVKLVEVIEARRINPDAETKLAIWIYPYGHKERFDALKQARFAFDAIVARLFMTWNMLPPELINMGPHALQNPSLTDWQLSPASFAANPKSLIGENGCEELIPANLALQEFVLRQVVRLTDVPDNFFGIPAGFKAAYVDEYKVSWYSLGHSLGEILYSLPLAPGETVKLAVIDWSWDSLAKRDETTKLTENILHQTHRDRTITETVKAGLKEMQHGSSFMGGVANSIGASLGDAAAGLGAAIGNTFSLGGSTATSDGSRALAAENVQRLSDGFSQASSAQREINSTVVIQARQEEKESIQTRTFSNYNHSHTLTVLYYEVLRHYRVTVEWVRRRPAVLISRADRIWTAEVARKYRALLEPAVFDPRAKAGFDALEQLLLAETDDAINPKPAPPPVIQQRDWQITSFLFTVEVGEEETTSGVHIEARLTNGTIIPLLLDGNPNINKDELFNNDGTYPIPLTPQTPVKWGDLVGIDIYVSGNYNLDLPQIGIEGMGAFPKIVLRSFSGPQLSFIDANKRQTIGVNPAGPDVPVPPVPPKGKQRLTPDQNTALARLLEHLATFPEYYERVLYLGRPADDLAAELAAMPWTPGSTVLDHVDPMPLETFGNYVAYPLAKQSAGIDDTVVVDIAAALNGNDPARRQWALDRLAGMSDADRASMLERLPLASAKSERLNTMSTRGVFAEGKLGHCNVSEEIDNTRFWKWEEHPIPIEAPSIAPVTPIQPTPQQVTAAPTPFPQSLVNIVNPSPAPDPTGLGAALQLLGTPNIFRDMSGRQEVADLLKKLSDNSIEIAEAATKAQEIQAKYGTDLDKHQKEYDLGIYKAAAEVEGKKVEAEAKRAAQAEAAKAEADAKVAAANAKKAEADAAKSVSEAATYFPKQRDEIRKQGSQVITGNLIKEKTFVFKSIGYNGQLIPGSFELYVRDVAVGKQVVEVKNNPGYYEQKINFSDPEPKLEARVYRQGHAKIVEWDIELPPIDILTGGKTYIVNRSHAIINLILTQQARNVSFKAKSTNAAVDELLKRTGVEAGVDHTVAVKLIQSYEQKNGIQQGNEEEKSYTLKVPTTEYELKFESS
ncbi:hypothetical protein [Nitrosomonas sp.]|uniref:hypothetical protein n=1 Tax=Nitrosomonas sp. TaxID=42353 RepID=UPI0037C53258